MKTNRAYALLEIKAMDDDARIIEGIATTPTTDRMGDIVEPKGAEFKLPLPFLWQHNSGDPIGWVIGAKATKDGISVKIQIAKIDQEGNLKKRIDDYWQMIKAKLVRGLSIGFKSLESSRIDDSWGYRFLKWEWLELSAVTIPANVEATIQTVKSIDTELRAASGIKRDRVVRLDATTSPGASGSRKSTKETAMKTIQEQIQAFEAQREAKRTRMEELMTKAGEEGATLDDESATEYDTLETEIEAIDKHIERLRKQEKLNVAKATRVVVENPNDANNVRGGQVRVSMKQNLPPGIEFARYAQCLAAAKGNHMQAHEIAVTRFPDNPRIHVALKAAVAAGTTTDATWAGPLVEYQDFAGDFVEYLRPQTIIGKFGQGNVPSLRRVPFNVRIKGQTSGGAGYWVGQGAPKPLTKFDFTSFELAWAKVANIAVITEELARFSSPSAEALVRDALAGALIERLDIDFIDPAKAAVANVSPAGITNGLVAITSSGNDADAIREDVKLAMQAFIDANNPLTAGVWVMSATTALALSLMTNQLGQREFPNITMNGGEFMGLPVIVSQHVPYVTAGGLVVLVNASDIWLADDGQVVVDVSREASLQMLDNPTNDSSTATATTLVSLWQTNSIGLKAERFINWQRRRDSAVAYIENVLWGTPASA